MIEKQVRVLSTLQVAANQKVKEKDYWLKRLSGGLVKSNFPYDSCMSVEDKVEINKVEKFEFPGEIYLKLMRLSNDSDARLYMILTAGVLALLYKYSGNNDLLIGSPVYRQQTDADLINTVLPLRVELEEGMTFKKLILEVKQEISQGMEYYGYPIELLPSLLNLPRSQYGYPLFDVAALLTNIHRSDYLDPIDLNMIFSFSRQDGHLTGALEYNSLLYKEDTINRIIANFRKLVADAIFNIDLEIIRIDMVSLEEKNRLLFEFNRSCAVDQHEPAEPMQKLIEKQVDLAPHKIAVIFADRSLTYRELNHRSNRLAQVLRENGAAANKVFGVMVERSLEMIIAVIGIMKSGAAFLPIDPGAPLERIDYVLADSKAELLVSHKKIANRVGIPIHTIDIATLSRVKENDGNIVCINSLSDAVYVIYTSGTTGKPKGVIVQHGQFLNTAYAWRVEYNLVGGDFSLLQVAAVSFDVFAGDIARVFINGGRMVICPSFIDIDFETLYDSIREYRISLFESIPALIFPFMEFVYENGLELDSLKLLIIGSDSCSQVEFNKIVSRFGKSMRIINSYGVTEAVIDTSYYEGTTIEEIKADIKDDIKAVNKGSEIVPIGKPLPDMKCYILDRCLNIEPIGAAGELYIGGKSIARGYINNPVLTGDRFLFDPFSSGEVVYKTGDLARWSADGDIEFLGRIDHQVKIRGFRIELGEIESTLLQDKNIKSAVAVVREDRPGDKYICAFLVSDKRIDVTSIRNFLSGKLPHYMIPTYFVQLEKIPLTPHGKVDRTSLAGYEIDDIKTAVPYVTEEMLREAAVSYKIPTKEEPVPIEASDEEITISREERARVLYEFNRTAADFPYKKTIAGLFTDQVSKTPDTTALVSVDRCLSYSRLNEESNRSAHCLRLNGIRANATVGMITERSLEMMIGIIGIWQAGGTFMPIDPEAPLQRKLFILNEGRCDIVLTDETAEVIKLNIPLKIIDIKQPASYDQGSAPLSVENSPDDLSHVLYTSGTTGRPKGVLLKHRSVVNLIKYMTDIISYRADDNVLSLTPITFDVFTAEAIIPLIKGLKVVIGSQEELFNYKLAASIIEKAGITIISSAPSFIRRMIADPGSAAVLKSLRYVLLAGEPLLAALLERLKPATNGIIYNLYGPTETTIYSTAKDVTGENSLNIGKPIYNTQVYIVDRKENPCPIGSIGELCIGGAGAARGYLNRPELTAEKFVSDMQGAFLKNRPLHPQKTFEKSYVGHLSSLTTHLYKTGDLARWLPDGDIEFIGRQDHQVKIGGVRVEPGEIENCLLTHKDIKEAVVVTKPSKRENWDDYLCAYLVSDARLNKQEIKDWVSGILPYYMVPYLFFQLEKMPLTHSGKIDRKLLAGVEIEIENNRNFIAPRDEIEERLAELWAKVLGIEKDAISMDANFFDLGGQSLSATILVNKIHKAFNVRLPLVEIFRIPTITELARYIEGLKKEKYAAIETIEKKEYYALSSAQRRLYILQQLAPASINYHLPHVIRLGEGVDIARLEKTFTELIRRHESLRTSFYMREGNPVQEIHEEVNFKIQIFDVKDGETHDAESLVEESRRKKEIDRMIKGFIEPFDLTKAPLLRVGLIRTNDNRCLLVIDLHHIITDGASQVLLESEFRQLYSGNKLSSSRLQYKDYAAWQNSYRYREDLKQKKKYWLEKFSMGTPVLNLPCDFERTAVPGNEGDFILFEIDNVYLERLPQLKKSAGVTTFMIFLALYNVLLHKITGQEEIIIGSVLVGRNHADLENIIGMFVNTLAMINFLGKNITFKKFLHDVKKGALEDFSNQDYQFEELVGELVKEREPGRNPLFDVGFTFFSRDKDDRKIDIEKLNKERSPFDFNSRFDLDLSVWEQQEKLICAFDYRISLFKRDTIKRLVDNFKRIISAICQNEDIILADIKIHSDLQAATSGLIKLDEADFGY